jgi:CheY-like chemotaxis protein
MFRGTRAIRLPYSADHLHSLARPAAIHPQNGFPKVPDRVLIIDDDPVVTGFVAELLGGEGYDVRVVNRSREALAAGREFQPDAVIVDFQMPEMHGGDIAWQFSADAVLRTAPLVIFTAFAERVRKCQLPPRSIPILEKPIEPRVLLDWLRGCGVTPAAAGVQLPANSAQ